MVGRFTDASRALKSAFPGLKMYAFGSYIGATRGRVSFYLDLLEEVRSAELTLGMSLIDGFLFQESYVYLNQEGVVRAPQEILDDTESLHRAAPMYRYDVFGDPPASTPDLGYVPLLAERLFEIFGRHIDLGISEYLPAGPLDISETDTSVYDDIDFALHWADVVGIYAEYGLDYVSTIVFGDSNQMHECYYDRAGNRGLNSPLVEELADSFRGTLVTAVWSGAGQSPDRIRAYAATAGDVVFVVLLNKSVEEDRSIQVVVKEGVTVALKLPARSYTSILVEGAAVQVSSLTEPHIA